MSGWDFEALGAAARLGVPWQVDDDHVSSSTAVISHAFWLSVFGGDPRVLGRRLTVNQIEFVVSGVMPAGFSGHSAARVDVWVPLAAAMRNAPGWNLDAFRNVVSVIARVEPGQEVAAAAQATTALERRVTLVGLAGGDVAPAERRIAYALAGVLDPRPHHRAGERRHAAPRPRHAHEARVGDPRRPRGDAGAFSLPRSSSKPRSWRRSLRAARWSFQPGWATACAGCCSRA